MMRSKKRNRVRQAITLMEENEQKYIDLTFWSEANKEELLESEDYLSLKRLQDIEEKYSKDIEYIQENDSWGYGFLFGMLCCTKSYKSIVLNESFQLAKFSYLDVGPDIEYSSMNKFNRVKEAVRLMYKHDTKYCDLVHYSRINFKNFKCHADYRKHVEKFQIKYPKETFELSPGGRNSDRQHGFHSGILAGCRLYSSVIDEGLEQALEEFPFLDS
jgi:hypothetical protein